MQKNAAKENCVYYVLYRDSFGKIRSIVKKGSAENFFTAIKKLESRECEIITHDCIQESNVSVIKQKTIESAYVAARRIVWVLKKILNRPSAKKHNLLIAASQSHQNFAV